MLKYAKAIVGLVGAGAAALTAALADGSITGAEWVGILLAVATGGAVARVPNRAPITKSSAHDLPGPVTR